MPRVQIVALQKSSEMQKGMPVLDYRKIVSHDEAITWKRIPILLALCAGNSLHKEPVMWTSLFLLCWWTNCWTNTWVAGDMRAMTFMWHRCNATCTSNVDGGIHLISVNSWWRHQMETFSALLAICARNSPVTGKFPSQSAVLRSFAVFFDLRLNKRLREQSWGWWFETPSHSLWRHCNGTLLAWCLFSTRAFITTLIFTDGYEFT